MNTLLPILEQIEQSSLFWIEKWKYLAVFNCVLGIWNLALMIYHYADWSAIIFGLAVAISALGLRSALKEIQHMKQRLHAARCALNASNPEVLDFYIDQLTSAAAAPRER